MSGQNRASEIPCPRTCIAEAEKACRELIFLEFEADAGAGGCNAISTRLRPPETTFRHRRRRRRRGIDERERGELRRGAGAAVNPYAIDLRRQRRNAGSGRGI